MTWIVIVATLEATDVLPGTIVYVATVGTNYTIVHGVGSHI